MFRVIFLCIIVVCLSFPSFAFTESKKKSQEYLKTVKDKKNVSWKRFHKRVKKTFLSPNSVLKVCVEHLGSKNQIQAGYLGQCDNHIESYYDISYLLYMCTYYETDSRLNEKYQNDHASVNRLSIRPIIVKTAMQTCQKYYKWYLISPANNKTHINSLAVARDYLVGELDYKYKHLMIKNDK